MKEKCGNCKPFFKTLSGTILPLAKMNKNILRTDPVCTGWIGFTHLTGITNELSSNFLWLNRITEVFSHLKWPKKFRIVKLFALNLFCFKDLGTYFSSQFLNYE